MIRRRRCRCLCRPCSNAAAVLDLSPVIPAPDGAVVVDARVKVVAYEPQDPFPAQIALRCIAG
jgi:hypothetical protein